MDDATRDKLHREFPDVPVFTRHTTSESRAEATTEHLEAAIAGLYERISVSLAGDANAIWRCIVDSAMSELSKHGDREEIARSIADGAIRRLIEERSGRLSLSL